MGLILHIIYVNDFNSNILSVLSKIAKFADDNKLRHKAGHNLESDINQRDLNKLLN